MHHPPKSYGRHVRATKWTPLRSIIEEPEITPSGETISIAVGREGSPGGMWEKREHVVLSLDEAREYAEKMLAIVDGAS